MIGRLLCWLGFHKEDDGRFVAMGNRSAIEEYQCLRCGHVHFVRYG